jgi:hypothetical protein
VTAVVSSFRISTSNGVGQVGVLVRNGILALAKDI